MSIITFINGLQSSATDLYKTLLYLQSLGANNLINLESVYSIILTDFQRRVSAINSKNALLAKIPDISNLVKFSLADFSGIDQSQSTATIRIDAQAATTLESITNTKASINTITFSSSTGSVDVLDKTSNIYRVSNTNNLIPTGTFYLTLAKSVNLSTLVFDLAGLASNPTINISVSETGIDYIDCLSYSLNVYRLVSYFKPSVVKYIKLTITPSHPDNLGGSLYTFGLTDFIGNSTEFRPVSEVVSTIMTISPTSPNYRLLGDLDPGLNYFLSINNNSYQEVVPNRVYSFSDLTTISFTNIGLDSAGKINIADISNSVYTNSILVTDHITGTVIPILFGVDTTDPNMGLLTNKYISFKNNTLHYIPYNSSIDSNKTFDISYVTGPAYLTIQLKVRLSTANQDNSPIFTGAQIQQV